ncbi:hypothetical protein DB31_7951 [Hyalangium minutum]|uniref:Uncharacterized protein n=1 Tax=Hyalangium minutum TaxID=394096 RepID=A0A085WM01_9BACT|nr:hypothetical protein DB31_7951 [Hyalangium minutum]
MNFSDSSVLPSLKLVLGAKPEAPLFTGELTSPEGDFLLKGITSSKLSYPLTLFVLQDGAALAERSFPDKASLDAVLLAETKAAETARLVILELPSPEAVEKVVKLEASTATRAPVLVEEAQTETSKANTSSGTVQTVSNTPKAPSAAGAPVPAEELRLFPLRGFVTSTRTSESIAGYVLEISCPDTIALDDKATPIHREITLGYNGAFQVDFTASGRFADSPLTLVVRTPNGLPARIVSPPQLTLTQALKLASLEVKVEPFTPPVLTPGSSAPTSTRVLKGRLVERTGKAMKSQQIILYGQRLGADGKPVEVPLATVSTHSTGSFSAVLPNEPFTGAYAVVSARPDTPCPVLLDADGRFPAFTQLVIEAEESPTPGGADEDCACHEPTPRLPGTEELVAGESSYSQDIGGSCVNFTVPNRTLEEFSHHAIVRTTDPRGQLVPINENPRWEWNGNTADTAGYAKHLHRTLRQTLGPKNPIRWDDEATEFELYQAVTLAHGHVLHFKQTFKADGYSMGDLLYSLPLAPGQKKQLVIYDWNRVDEASRAESTDVSEQLSHSLSRDRDIDEILTGTLSESMKGGSKAKTKGWSAGLGLAGSGSKDNMSLGIATGFNLSGGSGTSSAWQDNTRDMTSSLHNRLRDSTMQATSSVRSQRSTVVTSARQGETFSVQTEVVANHNHCHALTIQYFEILRHFVVQQELVDVQECLFVPLTMSRFTDGKVLRWRECLSEHLLYGPDTAKGQELRKGFDAVERISRNYQGVDFPQRREANGTVTFLPFCEESIDEVFGEFQLRLTLSRPADAQDGTLDINTWATLSHLFRGLELNGVRNLFVKMTAAERDRAFQEQHAPALARNFVEQLRFEAILADGTTVRDMRLDCTLLTDYAPGKPLTVSVRSTRVQDPKALQAGVNRQGFSGTPTDLKRSQVVGLRLLSPSVSVSGSFAILDRGTLRYRTRHHTGVLLNDRAIRNDIGFADQIFLPTPLTPEEQRNPWQEDQRMAQQLRDHLNRENLEYYHHVIWCHGITPHRRYMMLDRIHLAQDEFNTVYAQRGVLGRSLASLVENRLLGVAGNCLIFPVARGFNLDPTYELGRPEVSGSAATAFASLLEHYQTEAEREGGQKIAFRLSVPTPGVFAEAVRGACNACERIDDTRFWRWEQSPIDEPTAINPVSTDSRYQAPQDTKPSPLAQPVVNIQNAPAAPDPTGVGALLTALGQASPFANLTGLDQNQKNALAAMTSNQEAAKSYAQMATQLAMAAQSSRNAANLNDQIDRAFPPSKYPEKNQEWKERVLQAQLGGGSQPGKQESPLQQMDLMETIGAVRQSPGMEVSVGESQVEVRNGAEGRQPTGGTEGSSGDAVGTPQPEPTPEPSTWPPIEGYAAAKAMIPQLFEIIETSDAFQERAIEPFCDPDAPDYVPLVMTVRRQPADIDGWCGIQVRDPSDTTTPGGHWVPLYSLSRELPGFDPNQHLRIFLYMALGGMVTWHPGGMALVMSHELALHGLSARQIILRARSEGWTLRALRDFYVTHVDTEVDHRQIMPGTNADYEAVNNDLERVLQQPRWRRMMVKLRSSFVTPAGERVNPNQALLALPTRAVAPHSSSLYNLNLNHRLYSAFQLFVFDRQMEKDVFYNPNHFFTFLGKGSRVDTRAWDYLDPQQGGQ